MAMLRHFIVKLMLFILVLPFVLEVTVRVFAPQQLIRLDNIYIPDEGLGRIPAPNLDLIVNTGENDTRYITDDNGFRVGALPPIDPTMRILAMGDSFTVAMQVEHEDSFVGLLESALSAELSQTVAIDNASSANFDLSRYRIQLRRQLSRTPYDLVLVFLYTGNDIMLQIFDHFPANPNPPPTLQLPRDLSRSELENALLRPISNGLEASSHLFTLFKDRASLLLARLGLSRSAVPEVLLRANATDPRWEANGAFMGIMQMDATGYGVPIVFVLLPSRDQVDPAGVQRLAAAYGIAPSEFDSAQPARLLGEAAAQNGVELVDVLPAFREAYQESSPLFGSIDSHLSPAGHQVVAAVINARVLVLLEARTNGSP